ncbi:hypothetical protein GGR53DRAFT_500984 [Hypoxylon sp. FL1150]|nr:hypothetical protein GGR53DRAFT_500984 [Hypoxylon sp. FL1150]
MFCRGMLGEQSNDSAWVLCTFGWPSSEVKAALSRFQGERGSGLEYPIQVSAVFDDDVLSLSGPEPILEEFKSKSIPPSVQCRWAHVHGYYHGGLGMEEVVTQVLNDVKRRRIDFPTWSSLRTHLRMTTTGDRTTKGVEHQTLLDMSLRSIFVDMCDWNGTRDKLFDEVVKDLNHDSKARSRIICLGPGTKALAQSSKGVPTHPRLTIIDDVSDLQQEDTSDSIAIVGLSVNYPGAKGKEQFWDILEKGKNVVSEIPPWRFDVSRYDESSTSATRKFGNKYGNFLEDPFQFDAGFFNISPREAKSMDPQQRLILQAALEALEDSGYAPDSTRTFQKDSFGVYVGVATGDYVDNLRDNIDVYYSPGTLRAFLSGRISYAFGFHGPSLVVDTACSSSLVGLYQACQALRSGECTAALAGGVNVISSPDMYIGLARAHFLNSTGQCKPFDAGADGYCRAEGCGMVVLKKLSDAIEEGDQIYGVIRGVGINQCGTAKSITHPDKETQAALFQQLLTTSNTDPDSISVVEAHGTGTQAGDYAEVSSLTNIFGTRTPENPLYLSSVKGHIGHAEAASGVAGLAKLLLMMQKQQIPPQASFKSLNPRLADNIQGKVIPTQLIEWKPSPNGLPRRALLNNFGAAGSNAALIIEEYRPKTRDHSESKKQVTKRTCHVLNLSAKSEQALESLKQRYISYIESHPEVRIEDLCYTANARKQDYAAYRLSVTGSDLSQLLASLRETKVQPSGPKSKKDRKTVFVFSGQGHAKKGMGAGVLATVPEFRNIVKKCERILTQNGFPAVSPFLADSTDFDIVKDTKEDIIVTQSALFVLEYALARMWIHWGLTPDIVLGHSIGEYAALAIAGTLDFKDALLLVAKRAELIGTKCIPGTSGMVSCRSTAETLTALLSKGDQFPGLSLACLNSQEDIVVAGPVESLTRFVEYCNANGIKSRQLQVPYGFHSTAMDPIKEELEACVSFIETSESTVLVGSSLQGKLLGANEKVDPSYLVNHTRDAVQFYSVIEDIERSFPETELDFVEVGPSPSTESMIRKTITAAPYTFLPSLRPADKAWDTLASSLGSLFQRNRSVRWREVYDGSFAKFLSSAPTYPLKTSRYFVQFKEPQPEKSEAIALVDGSAQLSFEFLGLIQQNSSQPQTSFSTEMSSLSTYIKAHTVGGVPLCPASVLMELALEALSAARGTTGSGIHLLEDIAFDKPLVYAERIEGQHSLQTVLDMKSNEEARFSCLSQDQLHVSGRVTRKSVGDVVDIFTRKEAYVKRQIRTIHADPTAVFDSFSPKTIYEVIFPRVVAYSSPFLTLKQLSISESRLEGCGTFQLETSPLDGKFVCPPAFSDTLLHAAGFIANIYVPSDVACICASIERAMLPSAEDLGNGVMTIYCNLTDLGHSVIADSYVINSDDKIVAFVEGSCFKKIPLKAFHSRLSRLAGAPAPRPAPLKLAPATTSQAKKTVASQPEFQPASQIEDTIQSIIRDACGVSITAAGGATLSELGIDSLMLIEIAQSIRSRLPHLEIGEASIERCATLQELVATVSKASGQEAFHSISTPDLIQDISPQSSAIGSASATPATNDLEVSTPVENILLDTCGIQVVDGMKDLPLSSLGVDSLLSIELTDELQGRFGLTIDDSKESISDLTFRRLEALFSEKFGTPTSSLTTSSSQSFVDVTFSDSESAPEAAPEESFDKVIQRQAHGAPKRGVYLFHDGSGHCSMYSHISGIDRDLTGVYSADPLSATPKAERLEDLAELYIKRTNLLNEQEVILGGWSFGGVLAFEISRQLRRLGRVVKGVVLIDSPPPVDHQGLPQEIISYVVEKKQASGPRIVSEALKQARIKVGLNFQHHATLLQNYRPEPRIGDDDVPCVMVKCSQTMDTETLCSVAYPWLSDEIFRTKSIQVWERLVGRQIPVLEVACNHFEVFDSEHVREVSEKLKSALDILESPES